MNLTALPPAGQAGPMPPPAAPPAEARTDDPAAFALLLALALGAGPASRPLAPGPDPMSPLPGAAAGGPEPAPAGASGTPVPAPAAVAGGPEPAPAAAAGGPAPAAGSPAQPLAAEAGTRAPPSGAEPVPPPPAETGKGDVHVPRPSPAAAAAGAPGPNAAAARQAAPGQARVPATPAGAREHALPPWSAPARAAGSPPPGAPAPPGPAAPRPAGKAGPGPREAVLPPFPLPVPAATLPTAAPAPLSAPAPVAPAQVPPLLAHLANAGGEGRQHVHLRLHPAHLGEVEVHLNLAGGALTVEMRVATEAARAALDQQQALLQQALAGHGIQLDQLRVVVGGGEAPPWRGGDHKEKQPREQAGRIARLSRRPAGPPPGVVPGPWPAGQRLDFRA